MTMLSCSSYGANQSLRPLCGERVVLYRGESERAVARAATSYGKSEMHSNKNICGEQVSRRLLGIEKLESVLPAKDEKGWEITSG